MSFLVRAACYEFRNFQLVSHVYSRCFATTVSSKIAEFFRLSYTTSKLISRDYSVTSAYHWTDINKCKLSYIKLHEDANKEKTKKVFIHTLKSLKTRAISSKNGTMLKNYLLVNFSYEFLKFNQEDSIENILHLLRFLLSLYSRPLIKGSRVLSEYDLSDYIFTLTELHWGFAVVGVPFTRMDERGTTDLSKIQEIQDQCPFPEALPERLKNLSKLNRKVQRCALAKDEKDATAATLLAIPHLDENTLLYEVGCWNGQNILNLLFYASLKGRLPKHCIGSDINYIALAMAQFVSSLLSIVEPFIQFHLSNALDPLDPECLDIKFDKQVRLALRLIPVLEHDRAKVFLFKTRECLDREKDVLILSYALPNGKRYENNRSLTKDLPHVTMKEFSEGVVTFFEEVVTFFEEVSPKNYRVVNTYYTLEAFSRLAQECGFEIRHTIIVHDDDNERAVVLLVPKHKKTNITYEY